MKTIPPYFERNLIEHLQPIRFFALAQVLNCAIETGLLGALLAAPAPAEELARRLELDTRRLSALLTYLQNENYAYANAGCWHLTTRGRELLPFAPWYQLLVGGYATSFQQLDTVLTDGGRYATRNGPKVSSGSCGISEYDALPLTEELLAGQQGEVTMFVDLGCGSGTFLLELLSRVPAATGIGLEPDAAACAEARRHAVARGISDRVSFRDVAAAGVRELSLPDDGAGVCFVTAFVLQEVLMQDGEPAVEALLRDTLAAFPHARWVVIEVDHQPTGPIMAHGLGLAYYNPYFLLHAITEQRLERRGYWEALFERAGLVCERAGYPGDAVDSTRLEIGFLLRMSAEG